MAGPRLSQYYNQVVGLPEDTGEVRVRRMYADVLIADVGGAGPLEETVNQAMSMTDSVTKTGIYSVSPSSSLSLTGTAALKYDEQTVNHAISFVDAAVGVRDVPAAASNAMVLGSIGGRTNTAAVESVMLMSHIMGYFNYVDDRKPCGNVMALTQLAVNQDTRLGLSNLGLVQTVEIGFPIKPVVVQPLGLSQHTSTPYHFWVTSAISFSHAARVPLPTQHLTDTINFVHDSPIGRVDQALGLTDAALVGFSNGIVQTISLTDAVDRIMIYDRTLSHTDVVGHALTWYEDTPCGRKQYTPFQGENTIPRNVFSAPNNDLQDPQGDTGNFSLYIPDLGVKTNEVILRNPELDNRDRNAYTRVSQETRGGKLIVYSDPQWPRVRTLAVTIVGLLESKVDELQDFLSATLGQEVGLTDWEGRLWKGFVTNPGEVATQDGRSMWTVTFEFEGEMLEVEQPGNDNGDGMAMNMSQSVTAVIV